jgi:hypothetical protein
MTRNDIMSPHFGQRGLFITFANIAYPPNSKCTIGRALRKSYVRNMTDVWKSNERLRSNCERFFRDMKFAQCSPRAGTKSHARIWSDRVTNGDFPMRSKLAISALVVASLFGSTLIASAQTQTAPSASSAGTVSPGAASGKKTQHEKGMTTGANARGGANKSGTMAPSGPNNAVSGADNMTAPKSGSK